MSALVQTEKTIFLEAAEIAAPAERAAFLDLACGGDQQLRVAVEALLASHQQSHDMLDATRVPRSEFSGTMIGPYKLLQQLGEGGMGVVYMAEQTAPVQRRVALKIIKPGMDSRQVIARFAAEKQALALMDHVNIARVLDAGTVGVPALACEVGVHALACDSPASQADTLKRELQLGRPYFVMELVHGIPITKYCDDNHLTPRQRLKLFVPVCQAIQHAHQKGIIHRDIKPSNVLITLYDGQPVPKVIDFGIAKATEQKLTEQTLFTQFGTMVGTLEYMSPEQAEMSALGVDTRSDIYSLGVLLYELLTGSTPFTKERFKQAAYDEIRRIIREEEPPKPSTRLSDSSRQTPCAVASDGTRSMSATLASISAQRQTEPARLSKLMRGELDWIVMKTLEKDRNRRYESASGLAADVQRYLDDEPVQACPPSAAYRFRKFIQRNKGAFAIVTTAAAGVLLAVVMLAVSNFLIRQEQARTRDEKDRAEQALKLAENRADEIRQGLERLKAANALLERAKSYDNWQQWDSAAAAYTKAIELRHDHAPAWEGRGELYARLGLWELTAADLVRAADLQGPTNSRKWFYLALSRLYLGDLPGYRADYAQMNESIQGSSYRPFTMETVRIGGLVPNSPGDAARSVELAQAVVAADPGPHWHHHVLGVAHYRAGQYELAIERLQKSPAADPDWVERPLNYPFVAMAHYRLGRHDEAEKALAEAVAACDRWTEARYQIRQDDWVVTQGAAAHWGWWNMMAFQLFYREARELMGLPPPPDDPRLHVLRARAFAGLRRNFEADVEYAAALKLRPDDPQIRLEAHRSAAYSAAGRRQWKLAAAEFTKASDLTPGDANLWRFRAVALLGAEDVDGYRQTCLAMFRRFEKSTDFRVAGNVILVCVLRDDALPDMAQLLPLAQVAGPWGHAGAYALGEALYRAGKYEEAARSIEAEAKTFRPGASEWSFLAMAHHRLGHADEARRYLAMAARWIDEANRKQGEDLTGTEPDWGSWHEPIWCPLLFREAEELLSQKSEVRSQRSEGEVRGEMGEAIQVQLSNHRPTATAVLRPLISDL